MKSEYRGYYIGINRDGKVDRVSEYLEGGSIVLSQMNEDGVLMPHPVMKGQRANLEVGLVFGLREAKFVPVTSEGTPSEKAIIEGVEAKAKG